MIHSVMQKQRIVPEEEWDAFIMTLRKPLPTTFRINGRYVQRLLLLVANCRCWFVCVVGFGLNRFLADFTA